MEGISCYYQQKKKKREKRKTIWQWITHDFISMTSSDEFLLLLNCGNCGFQQNENYMWVLELAVWLAGVCYYYEYNFRKNCKKRETLYTSIFSYGFSSGRIGKRNFWGFFFNDLARKLFFFWPIVSFFLLIVKNLVIFLS